MVPGIAKLLRMKIQPIAFIGGGNMASALIGGLLKAGRRADSLLVVEPNAEQRQYLQQRFGIDAIPVADARLADAAMVVWAVKPQLFAQASAPCRAHVQQALQVSVMAGIRSVRIEASSGSAQVVRAMPNTPALIGQGIAALYARPEVSNRQREQVQALFAPTGESLWVEQEDQLDGVTALSGSGPAYVFFFIEAMMQAAVQMGLSEAQGRQLAQSTFAGATALAKASELAPAALRAQVTSKGGTTHAAITSLQEQGVAQAFITAILAARDRAKALANES